MAAPLELEDARTRVRLLPDLGGAVADMRALTARGPVPVLRDWGGPKAGRFGVGNTILVPFSNRISGGGFHFDDGSGARFHPVAPNMDGQPFPIHGDGFQKPWAVEAVEDTCAVLTLTDGCIGPFRYAARLTYTLRDGALDHLLTITNTGPKLPFGGGFHPWFPRRADTRLYFSATSVWLEDDRHLPTGRVDLFARPDWDIGRQGRLPDGLVNNAFCGWKGRARIDQPSLGITVQLEARAPLGTAIVYSPAGDAEFFCFEPVSHAVDAHNQPGQQGLVPLDTGETLTLSMSLGWDVPATWDRAPEWSP